MSKPLFALISAERRKALGLPQDGEKPTIEVAFTRTEDGLRFHRIAPIFNARDVLSENVRVSWRFQEMPLNVEHVIIVDAAGAIRVRIDGKEVEPVPTNGPIGFLLDTEFPHFKNTAQAVEEFLHNLPTEEKVRTQLARSMDQWLLNRFANGPTKDVEEAPRFQMVCSDCGAGSMVSGKNLLEQLLQPPDPNTIRVAILPHEDSFFALAEQVFNEVFAVLQPQLLTEAKARFQERSVAFSQGTAAPARPTAG